MKIFAIFRSFFQCYNSCNDSTNEDILEQESRGEKRNPDSQSIELPSSKKLRSTPTTNQNDYYLISTEQKKFFLSLLSKNEKKYDDKDNELKDQINDLYNRGIYNALENKEDEAISCFGEIEQQSEKARFLI